MNKIKMTYALALFTLLSFSQSRTEHYVLPEFSEGIIIMKDGKLSKGTLNYNALTESIILKEGEKYLPLRTDLERNTDTLIVKQRRFVNRGGTLHELLLDSKSDLFVEYYCVLKSNTEDRSAYGSTSQTSSSISLSQVQNQNVFYQLELPELYTAELKYRYYLVTEKGEYSFETLRDIKKHYNKIKKEYNAYRKTHKVNFKDLQSVRDLIKFLENV